MRSLSSLAVCGAERIASVEVAIGTVWNHRLTRLKMELFVIELNRDYVRFERHQIGDAADLGIGFTIKPGRPACVTNVVVTA